MRTISSGFPSFRRLHRQARVGLACLALSYGFAPAAFKPQDGSWTGTTSQGLVYNFTVRNSGGAINPLQVGYNGGGCMGTVTYGSNIPISGNAFSVDSKTLCPRVETSGTFTSATSASGTVKYTWTLTPGVCPCSGTTTHTWTATKALPQADLSITKTGPGVVTSPTGVTWRITVANAGPSDATGVLVSDPTPAGLAFLSNSGACTTSFPCSLGAIPAGQNRAIDATYRIPAELSTPATVENTATVTATSTDPDLTDNTSTAKIEVVPPGPASSFFTIQPCRLLDTREGNGEYGRPALVAGQDRTFVAIGSKCGIPATAKAVSVNLTATAATAQGNLRLYPAGLPLPGVSTINYLPGLTRANNAIVALSDSGEFTIRCSQGSGTAHAIVDVNGYYE